MPTTAAFNDASTPDVPHGDSPQGLAKALFDELYKAEFGEGDPVDAAKVARLIEQGADLSFQHPELRQSVFEFLRGYPHIISSVAHLPQIIGQDLVLTVAGDEEDFQLVQDLLKDKPDLNQRGDQGRSALMIAARQGFTRSTAAIAAAETDLLRTDNHGWTALMHAAMEGRITTAQVLVSAGMLVTARSPSGYTALDLALVGGGIDDGIAPLRIELAKLLVENGASLHIKNEKDLTPIEFLRLNGQEDAIKTLTAAEATYKARLAQTAVLQTSLAAPKLARFRRAG